jgi:hypothetical protein
MSAVGPRSGWYLALAIVVALAFVALAETGCSDSKNSKGAAIARRLNMSFMWPTATTRRATSSMPTDRLRPSQVLPFNRWKQLGMRSERKISLFPGRHPSQQRER